MKTHSLICTALAVSLLFIGQFAEADKKSRDLTLYVDADAKEGGRGTPTKPYDDIDDAMVAARNAVDEGRGVTLQLAPGIYHLKQTLLVDVPVQLQGSNVIVTDPDGWPEAAPVTGTETVLLQQTCEQIDGEFQPALRIGTSDRMPARCHDLQSLRSGYRCPMQRGGSAPNTESAVPEFHRTWSCRHRH
ncbi:MAG: hypothetical protein R3E84_16885 [Pseudomonadales bacterium]